MISCRYTAVSVMEMDFERIDINQCSKSQGNDGPNRFAGTDRCTRNPTAAQTTTEVRDGWLKKSSIFAIDRLLTTVTTVPISSANRFTATASEGAAISAAANRDTGCRTTSADHTWERSSNAPPKLSTKSISNARKSAVSLLLLSLRLIDLRLSHDDDNNNNNNKAYLDPSNWWIYCMYVLV